MRFVNELHDSFSFSDSDAYILTLGYETRACAFYTKHNNVMNPGNTICFLIKGFEINKEIEKKVKGIKEKGLTCIELSYRNAKQFHDAVIEFIQKQIQGDCSPIIHFDYSSMPRLWYSELPIIINKSIKQQLKICFWYANGYYPEISYYPSAGLTGFTFFAGSPSLPINKKRIHLLALGFDSIRTQAVVSIIDPEQLIVCYACDPADDGMKMTIEKANQRVLSQASLIINLPINDFEFMISKLSELIIELSEVGFVILIPDGPKPLIMALSILSQTIQIDGVSCMQLNRNAEDSDPIFVEFGNKFFGFSFITGE